MNRLPRVRWSVWSFVTLVACSSAEVVRPETDLAPFAAMRAQDFPGAQRILFGLAETDDDRELRVGDAVLFGVEFRRAGRCERQMLLLEVARLPVTGNRTGGREVPRRDVRFARVTTTTEGGDPEHRTYAVRPVILTLHRYDQEGQELQQSETTLYEESLQVGWWPRTEADAAQRDSALASLLMLSLQALANSDPMLKDLLFVVVDPPGLLSIAAHFGVKVTVRSPNEEARPCLLPDLPTDQLVRTTPLDLVINGTPSLWVEMLVTPSNGALMVSGGMVGAVARHPTEPDRLAVVRLLATRRGERAP